MYRVAKGGAITIESFLEQKDRDFVRNYVLKTASTNMREAAKNRILTPEAKAKMGFKGKGLGIAKVKKPCPHCGKLCAGNMLVKWHNDNCKKKD